jgi:hypothetical protein
MPFRTCYKSVDRLPRSCDWYARQSIPVLVYLRPLAACGRLRLPAWLKLAALDEPLTVRVSIPHVMMAFRTGEQMKLFRHYDGQASERAVQEGASRTEERPAWMRDGVKAALLEGDRDLEVVGESFYQENLWRLAAARPGEPVRVEITAVLVAEDDNPHDSNAIAVWIDGLKVGHLSRENARAYRPGLLALQRAHQMPIALTGVITGGGMRDDGPGRLGVFLRHDPEDFGLRPQPSPAREPTVRPGSTDALASEAGVACGAATSGLREADLEDARLTYLTNYNHRFMNSGQGSAEITAVVGTSSFQESLRQAAGAPRPWRHAPDRHVPAILIQAPDEAAAVAVLIDGHVVGYLSHDVADRHREQLDELRRSGHYLVCSALIVGGEAGKKYGVRLQVKPGIGKRWAADAKPPAP